MDKRFFAKLIFILMASLMTLYILSIHYNCDGIDGPEENGTATGGWQGSPEDSVIQELLHEFEQKYKIKQVRIKFFEGDIYAFIKILKAIENEHGHLDYIGFFSDGLDRLILEDLIMPYPGKIDETVYDSLAINAMKRNNVLYGIPIYTLPDGRVKGVGASSRIDDMLEEVIKNLANYVTSLENIRKIANAAGGTPARIQ